VAFLGHHVVPTKVNSRMSNLAVLIGIVCGVILGSFSNYLYDLLKGRVFRDRPTAKYLIILTISFFPFLLMIAASQTANASLWQLGIIGIVILIFSITIGIYGRRLSAWISRPPRLRKFSFLIVSLLTSLGTLYLLFFIVSAYLEQRTVYIVLDASEQMGTP
jgi:amino acid transporter